MKYEKSFYKNFRRQSHTFSIFKEHSIITIIMEKQSFTIHDNLPLEKIFNIFWLKFYSKLNTDFDVVTDRLCRKIFFFFHDNWYYSKWKSKFMLTDSGF